jgi:hypothetical protein
VLGLLCVTVACGPQVTHEPAQSSGGSGGVAGSSDAAGTGSVADNGGVAGNGGGAGELTVAGAAGASRCYSPTQHAPMPLFGLDEQGCACDAAKDETVCTASVGMACVDGFWHAFVDGPCMPTPQPGKACGARAGDTCSQDEYCAYADATDLCGAADAEASCRPRPKECLPINAAVCGCDRRTYDNACYANAAGVGVMYPSQCKS